MIVVYHEGRGRFEAVCSFFERSIPKENRWRWDAALKRWYTQSEDIARRLAQYAQGAAALRLTALSLEERQALADSSATDNTDLEIPAPPGMAYLPFQRAGIAYALNRRGTLIGDEMGLGKTVQAIGAVNVLCMDYRRSNKENDRRYRPDRPSNQETTCQDGPKWGDREMARPMVPNSGSAVGNRLAEDLLWPPGNRSHVQRVLIICPASLRLNWQAEWRRWHTGTLRPTLLDAWPGGLYDDTVGKALIVSYDSVRKWHPMIAATPWDVLIVDEAHMLKDESTRRAKSIFGGKRKQEAFEPIKARRKLFLTGTAIVNKAEDLWPLVKALAPNGLGASRVDFIQRYAGNNRLDELHLRLRSQIMVRRLKDDVLKDLPKKRRQIVLLDVANAEAILAAEGVAISLAAAQLERARDEIAGLPHAEQVMRLRQCRSIAMSEIARVRKETAMKKLPAAIEHIHDILGNISKAVCFVHHHDVFDGLQAEFSRVCVGLDGRTDLVRRQEAVSRFQQDGGVRLFIGGIQAAGLGLTLTAASTVVFLELAWTPAAMMQSEDRLHRIGQHSPVLVQHLVIDGSIDAKMARILIEKQAVMDAALDGGPSGDGGEAHSRDILEEVLRA